MSRLIPHWQEVIRQRFGIDSSLERLDGEFDLNFRGKGIIAKIMREGCDPDFVEMQIEALTSIGKADPSLPVPAVKPANDGDRCITESDENGNPRLVWVQEALPGIAFGRLGPQPYDVLEQFGALMGRLDAALKHFEHDQLARDTKWDLTKGDWIEDHLDAIGNKARRALVTRIVEQFEKARPSFAVSPRQAIHNDLNDYNILLAPSLSGVTAVSGLIDFGDMISAPRVCELAIAGAYAVLDHERPEAALASVVRGYHREYPLEAEEFDLIWPLLRMRLAVSVVNSAIEDQSRPGDPYVTISQAPAWRFLERAGESTELATARLRVACGLEVVGPAARVRDWLDGQRGSFAPIIGADLSSAAMVDLSIAGSSIPRDPFAIREDEAADLGVGTVGDGEPRLGRYGEPRLIYTSPAFRQEARKNADRRSVHLGVDIFAPAGTAVRAPLGGRVAAVGNRPGHLDYGGTVVLEHETRDGDVFRTLYGHLDPEVCNSLAVGQRIGAGEIVGRLGSASCNGGWAPHLHLQLVLARDHADLDLPGAANPEDLAHWQEICPNPAALLNVADRKIAYRPIDETALLAARKAHFGENLKLSYRRPVLLLRGWRHHMFDEMGRVYLDAYNNVPHVGHAHPRIAAVCADQLTRLNSNTRYLHPAQAQFAETILAKMPEGLDTVFMVNSGSEANELALRLARSYSNGKDMITPRDGYHGNTTGAMDLSSYKFSKPGGGRQPDWVHLVDVADDYRGAFRRSDPDRAVKFAGLVDEALFAIEKREGRLAGFIAETFPSVGGQIIPPAGYLKEVYRKIRAAGGVCIADEVQTGLGRLGESYFGFEQQGATPDIVVLGKPIGNGHPVGVVVTRREIAARFAEGPEFFSTFGGSTLSCRVAKTVLDIVDEEGLQENARVQGARLLDGLRQLQAQHPVIGDVRGMGLFIGVDLVLDRESLMPATEAASFAINRMRDMRILIGREGPADNVLKIRPPLTIEEDDIDVVVDSLDRCLNQVDLIAG